MLGPDRGCPRARLVGHRGVAAHAPENTLAGLRAAAAFGLPWVEVDAKLTADAVVILMHDETLDRTTDLRGPVAGLAYGHIVQADAGGWFGPRFRGERVPTLREAIAEMARLGLGGNIEIKPCRGAEAATGRAVGRILRHEWPRSLPPPVISSFWPEALRAAATVAPELTRAMLVGWHALHWRTFVRMTDAHALHIYAPMASRNIIRAAKRTGLPVRVFTVNEQARARALLDWGADAVITDDPLALATD